MKAVIFDFDYTLGDSTNGIVLSANHGLTQLGHEPRSVEEIRKTIGLSLKETYFVLTGNDDADKVVLFSKYFKEKADQVMVENTALYEDTKDILRSLKQQGLKTAIVTTKYHYRIEQILNRFDARNLIDMIVGAEDVKIEKPSPEGLLWTIDHLGVEKPDVLYVGDSLVDAQTAENAGVEFAAVLTGTTAKSDFKRHPCAYIGENLKDIFNYIQTKNTFGRPS